MKPQKSQRNNAFFHSISCIFFVGLGATSAHAAAFSVSNVQDAGAGSLRQAILDANASPGADLIDARKISGSISIRSALPDLSEVTIIGSGRNQLTIFGGEKFRVFNIPDNVVTLANISIAAGNAPLGAGVRNGAGKLTLSNVRLVANIASGGTINRGGGLFSSGPVVARDCLIGGNGAGGDAGSGGAIFMDNAPLELKNCEIGENHATAFGGAIAADGGARVSIIGGNFTKNVIADIRSGIYAPVISGVGRGGALHLSGGAQASISGTTFERNSAGEAGGAIWSGAKSTLISDNAKFILNMVHGAILSNGGGAIWSEAGTVTVRNSILQNNSVFDVGNGGAIFNRGGTLSVSGSQFIRGGALYGGAIETIGGQVTLGNTDFTGNYAGNYGGGGQRPNVLLGAGGALHASGAARVFVLGGTFLNNFATLAGGALWNDANSIVRVDGANFDANQAYESDVDNGGGALYNAGGTLIVRNARLANNQSNGALGAGGAIFNNRGTITVSASALDSNRANRAGGAIETSGGQVNLVGATITNNRAGADDGVGNGGALHVSGAGKVLLLNGEVSANNASSQGGGLWNSASGTLIVSGTHIKSNVAMGTGEVAGGGIYNDGGSLAIRGANIELNSAGAVASGAGGGIFNKGNASIVGAKINGNRAGKGGAIQSSGTLTVSESTLADNSVAGVGGAIENAGSITILRSTLAGNTADVNGGALHNLGAGSVFFLNSTAFGNSAVAEGGGLWNSATGTMSVRNSTIDGNSVTGGGSEQGGGGIYNDGGTLSLDSATITGNSASSAGGGILSVGGTVNSLNSIVALNNASNGIDVGGAFNSQGFNLIGVASGSVMRPGDLSGTTANPLDPRLGELDRNGGPTLTRLPQNGSPVIDAGGTSATTDQRGAARPQGARKDIGAVETSGATTTAKSALSRPSTAAKAPSGGNS